MYGQIAGAGAAAGVPAALAFTGVSSTGFAWMLGAGGILIVFGIGLLRLAHQRR